MFVEIITAISPRSLLSWCVPSVCDGYQTGEQIQKSTEKNTTKKRTTFRHMNQNTLGRKG